MTEHFDPAPFLAPLGPSAAAECHGTLVGALAAGEPPATAAALAAELDPDLDGGALEPWARDLQGRLGEGQLQFALRLPADAEPLQERIEALAAWVRGFLSGLGRAGSRLRALGAQVEEMLSDLDAIARGAAVTEGGSDAEERAYAELVEYVRLAVQSLFESVNAAPRGKMNT